MELNPVRAGIVVAPEDYRWSSYRYKTGKEKLEWLDSDPFYKSLGAERYKELVEKSIPEGEWELIREAALRGQLTGSNRFVDEV